MKIGFVLNNLGPNQLAFDLIRSANEALKDPGLDVVLFYEESRRPCLTPHFAIMPAVESWGYDGVLVATDRSTARKVIPSPAASKKYFLVYDLEWTRPPFLPFRENYAIYGDPNLNLLARSESHADAIANAWNRPPAVIGELLEILSL